MSSSLFFHRVRTIDDTRAHASLIESKKVLYVKLRPFSTQESVTTSPDYGDGIKLHIWGDGPTILVCVSREFLEDWKPVRLIESSLFSGSGVHYNIGPPLGAYRDHAGGQAYACSLNEGGQASEGILSWRRRECRMSGDVICILQFDRLISAEPNPPFVTPTLRGPRSHYSMINENDVALIFPFERTTPSPAVLWTKKETLMKLSDYFEAMFTGGYSESVNVLLQTSQLLQVCKDDLTRIVEAEKAKAPPTAPDSDDSDLEDEAIGDGSAIQTAAAGRSPSSSVSAINYVTISDTAYKTYEHLLGWATTGRISFAPLRSTHSASSSSKPSAKSTYKLAHQLGIQELEDIAAANFKSQLSHKNVLQELFSSTCFVYPVLGEVGMQVLDRDWAQVKESGGLDNIFSLVESDQGDTKEMMKVALEILKRASQLSG